MVHMRAPGVKIQHSIGQLVMTIALDPPRRTALPEALPSGASATEAAGARSRLNSIDTLRGLVMIVMALDHTRDFFTNGGFNPRDVAEPALFLTRWVTHFCAPTFILLAGISAYLYGVKGRTTGDVSRFLLTRGIWLVLIEFTIVRLGWSFDVHFNYFVAQVIFAIGVSMIALAVLVYLPRTAIAAIGLAMIAGHNAFDGIKAGQLGAAAPLWHFLHEPGFFDVVPGVRFFVLYPLIPWVGVMAAGYALGPIFMHARAVRVPQLFMLGAAITIGFVLLRATNFYGDPVPWALQDDVMSTILSFINCEKYPPSLLYLAMTLGPALMLLAAFESARGPVAAWMATFGRVPFFYYVMHIFLLHAFAVLFAWLSVGETGFLFGSLAGRKPPAYGLSLAGIYAVWVAVMVALYPLCRWFAGIKRRRTKWWWSYF
jgi:uncharacterized membrane protein